MELNIELKEYSSSEEYFFDNGFKKIKKEKLKKFFEEIGTQNKIINIHPKQYHFNKFNIINDYLVIYKNYYTMIISTQKLTNEQKKFFEKFKNNLISLMNCSENPPENTYIFNDKNIKFYNFILSDNFKEKEFNDFIDNLVETYDKKNNEDVYICSRTITNDIIRELPLSFDNLKIKTYNDLIKHIKTKFETQYKKEYETQLEDYKKQQKIKQLKEKEKILLDENNVLVNYQLKNKILKIQISNKKTNEQYLIKFKTNNKDNQYYYNHLININLEYLSKNITYITNKYLYEILRFKYLFINELKTLVEVTKQPNNEQILKLKNDNGTLFLNNTKIIKSKKDLVLNNIYSFSNTLNTLKKFKDKNYLNLMNKISLIKINLLNKTKIKVDDLEFNVKFEIDNKDYNTFYVTFNNKKNKVNWKDIKDLISYGNTLNYSLSKKEFILLMELLNLKDDEIEDLIIKHKILKKLQKPQQ